jgi:hypothetical protein
MTEPIPIHIDPCNSIDTTREQTLAENYGSDVLPDDDSDTYTELEEHIFVEETALQLFQATDNCDVHPFFSSTKI